MTKILHMSDMHVGSPSWPKVERYVRRRIVELCKKEVPEFILLTGDIVWQGNPASYEEALDFIRVTFEEASFDPNHLIVCPGNHDLCVDSDRRSFRSFDGFISRVRPEKPIFFEGNPLFIDDHGIITAICLNSSYHMDYRYGRCDINSIEAQIEHLRSLKSTKIALMHHSMLSVSVEDESHLRNSLETIRALTRCGVRCLFHGHQHRNSCYSICIDDRGLRCIGVRSLSQASNLVPIGMQLVVISGGDCKVQNVSMSLDERL